jgi:hypothetical protein
VQLRSTIFASKLKLALYFSVAAAATALLFWVSQSQGQLKLADKAKDAKTAAAFWRETVVIFSHVLEALSILPQAEFGGWTVCASSHRCLSPPDSFLSAVQIRLQSHSCVLTL